MHQTPAPQETPSLRVAQCGGMEQGGETGPAASDITTAECELSQLCGENGGNWPGSNARLSPESVLGL